MILNLASESFYQRKRAEFQEEYKKMKQRKGFISPSTNIVSAAGKPFVRLVLESLYEDRITASDVSDYLGVRLKHLEPIGIAVGME